MTQPNWFLALPLPPPAAWHEAAASAPTELKRLDRLDLHLTLAFLGPCGQDRAEEAWRALAALRQPAIRIRAGRWRGLGAAHQPSAYGLTLAEGQPTLGALLGNWAPLALEAAGRPPDRRPPLPHVTLLRPRRREARQMREPMERWMAGAPLPGRDAELGELALYTWAEERSRRLFRLHLRRPLERQS